MPHDTWPRGIAFIAGQLGLGGAEQQLYYLLSGLDRARFRPVVISLGPTPHEYWATAINELDIPVRHIPRRRTPALRALEIAAVLSRERAQIVHGWAFHTNGYSALAGRLAHASLRVGSMREDYQGLPAGSFLRWVSCRGLDLMITNSATTARQMQGLGLTSATVHRVRNGVPVREPVSPGERRLRKAELACPDADMLIGSIGRLDANKNHAMLLRVFARLGHKWPSLRLVIIGDGPLADSLSVMSEDLGIASRVHFRGAIPMASRYLPALEVCCLTSYTEGMPNLLMEAAAAATPVVSTRCGDSVELIEDGVSGYLVPVDDDTSMAARLDHLLTDAELRLRMGEEGREKMRREFSIPSLVDRMSQIYDASLAAKDGNEHRTRAEVSPHSGEC